MTTSPLIDPKWLTHPTDMELAVQGLKRQRQIWQVLIQLGVADGEEVLPGASVQSDAEIKQPHRGEHDERISRECNVQDGTVK